MFKKVKQFFRKQYVRMLEVLTNYVMFLSFRLMQRLIASKDNDLVSVELFATRFASLAADMVRDVVVLQGKDPDYVTPVMAAEVVLDETKADWWVTDTKERPKQLEIGFGEAWVKKPADHPILRTRAQFEAKQKAVPNVTPPLNPESLTDQDGHSYELINDSDIEIIQH